MPDITDLLKHWWKQILAVVILTLLAVGIFTFTQPKQYLSVATALPASAYSSDKSKIFSDHIQALYSDLGTPDDLDMILGTAQLDTIYLAVTDQFNLYDHYQIKAARPLQRTQSASRLRKNSRIIKSDYGELKVKTWDTDKQLAAELANALMDQLQSIHTGVKNAANLSMLNTLKETTVNLKKAMDSTSDNKPALTDRLSQYEKLISEYQLMLDSRSPALVIIEKARAAAYPDRPRPARILFASAMLSLLLALLAAMILERRKTAQ